MGSRNQDIGLNKRIFIVWGVQMGMASLKEPGQRSLRTASAFLAVWQSQSWKNETATPPGASQGLG
jgi:hypothetical protein